MKKQTKITQDKTQTRSTIPKVFVDKKNITNEDSVEWEDKNGKLKGTLIQLNKQTTKNSNTNKQ